MKDNEVSAHSIEVEEVANKLNTSTENGLSDKEVLNRLEKYGKNEIQETEGISALQIFLEQFKDFLIYLLFFAIIISIIIGIYSLYTGDEASEFIDALVIFIILIVNAVLGFYQEYKAERALESLKEMAPHYAKVIRGGKVKKIDVKDVVPGDILKLDEGDKIAADARLFKAYSLYADEAILTGESQPVKKDLKLYDEKTILADRKNIVYSNTVITRGNGLAIVISTGMSTEVGKIAEKIQEEEHEKTPFQVEIDRFGRLLGKLIIIICFIVFAIEFILILIDEGLQFNPEEIEAIIDAFKIAISLAVSAVPEGLVVVITVVMSIGMRRMAERNALVKTLTAVETLGRVNIICSDKTGTLTKNEMTVKKVYLGGKEYDVEGVGYSIEGKILNNSEKPINVENDKHLKRYLEVCHYCNNSTVNPRDDGTNKTDVIGDPTEISLKVLAMKMDVDTEVEKVDEIPFNSDRKMMSVVVRINGELFSMIKGAPDVLIEKAGKGLFNGEIKPLSEIKKKYLSKNNEFAENALRVLGIAYKPLNEGYSEEEIEQDFIYLGLAGIIDPARDEVKDSIEEARMAGIRTIMITGDHKITAIAIAKEIGLTDKEEAITGAELEEMSDEELLKKVQYIDVFARVTSEHKLRILRALKGEGKVVSMTGDGVNDAPAVKGANVGVAMGIKGTEVTREASDMILLDDDYSTIVDAIEEGRGIFETTKGFFRYMLSTNFDEIFLILTAYIVMKFFATIFIALPVLPIQILWLNIATDGIPAMVLGLTPTDPDVMKEEPREGFSLISEIKGPVLLLGIYTSITDITLYLLLWTVLIPGWAQAGIDPNLTMQYLVAGSAAQEYAISLAQTIVFTNLVVCELIFVYSCTSNFKPFWKFPNKHLFWATGLSLLLQLLILFTPLGIAFKVVPLYHPFYWITLLLGAFSVFVVDEIRKWRIRIKRGLTELTS
ncbi:MAG: HAD-IC family P-type ATPase [Candidatus Lokiarchaeota archaeon]|nr:HAD-IC family P-type ATPase [Candidatus Lokiarchaeota archaeon]MBD3202531.1 HAD-IC family P-type ATPase [Candidatus Lokiarchaeota archaeon]